LAGEGWPARRSSIEPSSSSQAATSGDLAPFSTWSGSVKSKALAALGEDSKIRVKTLLWGMFHLR
jgi:hypothetical protein